jgi:hypothetical protein
MEYNIKDIIENQEICICKHLAAVVDTTLTIDECGCKNILEIKESERRHLI